ncbi:MAG: C-GCAxxG-C-C family protein [Desulforhopalus sp.]
MNKNLFVVERVFECYWTDDINCATTTLRILSEFFEIELSSQVIDAAVGMHGAGKYGAQCGLVEGSLMFLGIFGRLNNLSDDRTTESCKEFAKEFECKFGSLQCSIIRPERFHPDNPPHICEPLTCKAVEFSINFISDLKDRIQ